MRSAQQNNVQSRRRQIGSGASSAAGAGFYLYGAGAGASDFARGVCQHGGAGRLGRFDYAAERCGPN